MSIFEGAIIGYPGLVQSGFTQTLASNLEMARIMKILKDVDPRRPKRRCALVQSRETGNIK